MARRQGRGETLNRILQKLIQASSDFEGAVVVSRDGLVIAEGWQGKEQSGFDVGAVATRAFELSDKTTETLGRGDLETLILRGTDGNMIITHAGEHALCVVLLQPQAKVGIATFEAARISEQIAAILV
jgi:predicted regulator of Ras-like GTPase activity (Roadblock/LC7/MglB family)